MNDQNSGAGASGQAASISCAPFGKTPDGQSVEAFRLSNGGGLSVTILTYGATVQALEAPDRSGTVDDIVLGHKTMDDYLASPVFFGCVVGRYANRIANGRFVLDGKAYQVDINNAPNCLHGGSKGFDKVVWTVDAAQAGEAARLSLSYLSVDGEQGFPGTVQARIVYTLDANNRLRIDFSATTSAPTVINLSTHSYWNLSGEGSGSALDHTMMIAADTFTPVTENLVPTGHLQPVAGTPFDFRAPVAVGARVLDRSDEQMRFGNGYDHNFVLTTPSLDKPVACLADPTSGRVLEIFTTEPGLQLYSGNYLDGSLIGKSGTPYHRGAGIALEPQHYPDSPNHPNFPSTLLRPGEHYRSTTIFRLSVE